MGTAHLTRGPGSHFNWRTAWCGPPNCCRSCRNCYVTRVLKLKRSEGRRTQCECCALRAREFFSVSGELHFSVWRPRDADQATKPCSLILLCYKCGAPQKGQLESCRRRT